MSAFNSITCPKCGHAFPLDEAVAEALRNQSDEHAIAKYADEIDFLKKRIATITDERDLAQQNELTARQEKGVLEDRSQNIDLEIARQVDAKISTRVAEALSKQKLEHNLQIAEERALTDSWRRKVDDLQRDSRPTLPVLKGDALEDHIETELEQAFRARGDTVTKISKGRPGADRLLTIRDRGRECGQLLVEAKNTKNWAPDWLDKAKRDQHESGADIVVIASHAVPPEISEAGGFGEIDGVWVADLSTWLALVSVLREGIIAVKKTYAAAEGKSGTAGALYDLLVSPQTRDTVRAMVKAIDTAQRQDDHFRAAASSHFEKQRKNRQGLVSHLAGFYGAIHAVVGGNAPTVPELEFDIGDAVLDDDEGDESAPNCARRIVK
jgi:hypothetical protein